MWPTVQPTSAATSLRLKLYVLGKRARYLDILNFIDIFAEVSVPHFDLAQA